jgi:hypothetical protein
VAAKFLFSGNEIKSKYEMKERTVPIPNTMRLESIRHSTTSSGIIAFWGVETVGAKPPFEIQVLLNFL